MKTIGGIVAAGDVTMQRILAVGGVKTTYGIRTKRPTAVGSVFNAADVGIESVHAVCRVVTARGV